MAADGDILTPCSQCVYDDDKLGNYVYYASHVRRRDVATTRPQTRLHLAPEHMPGRKQR